MVLLFFCSKMELTYNTDYMVDTENYKVSPYSNPKRRNDVVKRRLSDIEEIIIHCTAAGTEAWEEPITCIKYDLGSNHISRAGCPVATYAFYINQKGSVWQLVSMEIQTWHCVGHNTHGLAICINHDGVTESEITPDLYSSLVDTICHCFDKLDWSYDLENVEDRLHFHREYANKLCPGKLDKNQLIKSVAERLKSWGDEV